MATAVVKHKHTTKDCKVYAHSHKVELDDTGRMIPHTHEAKKKSGVTDLSDMIYKELGGTDGGLDWMKTNTQQSEGDRELKRMGW